MFWKLVDSVQVWILTAIIASEIVIVRLIGDAYDVPNFSVCVPKTRYSKGVGWSDGNFGAVLFW